MVQKCLNNDALGCSPTGESIGRRHEAERPAGVDDIRVDCRLCRTAVVHFEAYFAPLLTWEASDCCCHLWTRRWSVSTLVLSL
jgi:hypothetical protein